MMKKLLLLSSLFSGVLLAVSEATGEVLTGDNDEQKQRSLRNNDQSSSSTSHERLVMKIPEHLRHLIPKTLSNRHRRLENDNFFSRSDNLFQQRDEQTPATSFQNGEILVEAPPDSLPQGLHVKKYLSKAHISVVSVEDGHEHETVETLRRQGLQAEENLLLHVSALPNDYDPNIQWHFQQVQADQAWNISRGDGVDIAVIDSGYTDPKLFQSEFDSNLFDGTACIKESAWNAIDENDNVLDDSPTAHGTFIANLIAQTTNNGVIGVGLAHEACILPIKVVSSENTATVGDVVDGLYYAVDDGVKVINISLGISGYASIPVMDRALIYAYQKGVTVVAAAGNDPYLDTLDYPAIFPTVISVGATKRYGDIAPYAAGGYSPDLVAPGGFTFGGLFNIAEGVRQERTLLLNETHVEVEFGANMAGLEGTSFSCPHVSAVVAMLISEAASRGKELSPLEIKSILTTTTLDLGETGFDALFGHGLLQSHDALTSSFSQMGRPKPQYPF